MGKLGILAQIAFRNLFSSGMNAVIGAIVFAGTVLVVVGSSFVDSVDAAMSRSIIGSAAGHIQVYSGKSKDDVAVFGAMGGEADLAPIDDFAKIKKTLDSVDNIKTVVPMGINGALVTSGNTIDLELEKLRSIYRDQNIRDPKVAEQLDSLKRHVRRMVELLQEDMKNVQALASDKAIEPEAIAALETANSPQFWAEFDRDPMASLEFLENKVAPLGADSDLLYLHYVGTDLDQFQKSFDRMNIVDGTAVPSGHRGMLLSKFFYEEHLKLKTARRLDKIKEAVVEKKKKIADDPDLQRMVKDNQSQTREILFQLDDLRTREAVTRLQKALQSKEIDLGKLLSQLFDDNDQNFLERYQIFYDQVAPLLDLYRLRIGDLLTIKAFTRAGFVQSINVKVYGTFDFSGLENSPVAGGLNLMDIVSFRELYGYLTKDKLEEIEQIKREAGAKMLDRDQAEADLFGNASGKGLVAEATPGVIDEKHELAGNARALREKEVAERVYGKGDLEHGVVLSAAVILKDPKKLDRTMKDIEAAGRRDGLDLRVASWQKASGLIGQFVLVAKLVLYFAVLVIFVVVLVIMNNSMMMATLQRVQEIGTLRAIGAQRGFVLSMVLMETVLLGLIFGTGGALVGAGVMRFLATHGVAATSDVLYFFFSGPRIYPTMAFGNILAAFIIVTLVAAISTLYPAFLATRVSPLRAMQTEE